MSASKVNQARRIQHLEATLKQIAAESTDETTKAQATQALTSQYQGYANLKVAVAALAAAPETPAA